MSKTEASVSTTTTRLSRFVSCCDGTEIVFIGSIGVLPGVYQFIGASPSTGFGGDLIPNQCYTLIPEFTTDVVTYPTVPTAANFSAVSGCEDESCAECNPKQSCDCPEGFTYNEVTELCERVLETVAEYSGTLLPLEAGNQSEFYCDSGLRLYPDITSLTWPIYGTGSTNSNYTLNENNGAGAAVIPTDNVINEAFGGNAPGCNISQLDGGRLNKAGIWATGFPNNQELSFEFCIEVEGSENKQFVIGIAGDNYVKFYVDGSLAVDLDSPGNSVTTPFRHWHAFPLTLSPGSHTIKLSGLNFGSLAAFGAEVYDIDLATFQANLLYPAIGAGNCGSTEATLEQYILFSTRDYVGQSVPNPNDPGVWTCPGGESVDYCNGVPVCRITETIELACDCYLIIPCDDTAPFLSIDESYAAYVDSFVEVTGTGYSGCAYITQTETEYCNDDTSDIVPTGVACDCDLKCYYVSDSNGFFIVNNENEIESFSSVEVAPFTRVCSKISPQPLEGTDLSLFTLIDLGDCVDEACSDICFKLTNCETEEVIYSNSNSLIPHAYGSNDVVELLNREGCWTVTIPKCDCVTVTINGVQIDTTLGTTLNGRPTFSFEYEGTTYYMWYNNPDWFITEQLGIIVTEEIMAAAEGDALCVEDLGWGISGTNFPEITSLTTELCPDQCDCPIDVTVTSSYAECTDCVVENYYRLKSCTNTDVIYTGLNLEAYVGNVILTDCGCYEVELIDFIPPNPQIVQLVSIFDECIDCTRTYYLLEDCNDELNVIYTYTDLSLWLDKVVKLEGCSECWLVKEVSDPGLIYQSAGEVTLLQGYENCIECEDLVATCSTVFNSTIKEHQYQYLDLDGIIQDIRVESGEVSDKYCVLKWLQSTNPEGVYREYGNCQVFESDETPAPNECNCLTVLLGTTLGTLVYSAVHLGEFYNGDKVYELDIDGILYYIWGDGFGGGWLITTEIGVTVDLLGTIKSGVPTCPVAGAGVWTPGTGPEGIVLLSIITEEGDCPPTIVKTGICPPPVFPNKRVVTPGYNTPVCTPEKYDKITCNFADIMYKIVLEKRYGITNCCPEDDDKWIIKKELIDLQALKDPDYECSECSCNCTSTNVCSTCKSKN